MGRWIAPLVLALCATSCARWPNLDSIRSGRGDWNAAFRDANVILVARVMAVEAGPRRLMRARLDVENVLQGEPGAGTTVIYYHADSDNSLERRQRYVFFLTRDQGVLRPVWDRGRSAILVASGQHRTAPLPTRPVTEQVSVMLLTPGNGMNAAHFARDLAGSAEFAMSHLGRWQTAKLLKRLTGDPRPIIRQSACEQLTASYWGQDECWDQLNADEHGGGAAVSRATEQERRVRTADPDRWWKQMSAAFPPGELLDELRLLTTHKDPKIRARFCRFLRAHYPNETDCGCSVPRPAGTGQTSI